MIDVGGAALLGAAARNAAGVAAVADPAHYPRITAELRELGLVSPETRAQLAAEAFSTVAAYHAEIAAYLNQISGNTFPRRLALVLEKVDDLRYGENPHQRAAFYRETTHRSGTLADATRLQGDLPSFNNLLDLDAAYRIARDYTAPTVAIVKHTDPVGLASHDELVEAYRHALETDPVASFGGIVGVNRELDGATAREIAANSYEAVVAPGFSQSAIGILRGKPGLELLAVPPDPTEGMRDYGIASLDFKRVAGGLLVESQDELGLDRGQLQVVTKRRPTLEELTDLLFAWRAVRHVRSNAIVLARNGATVGIGAGQAQPPGLGRDRPPPGGRPGQARGHGIGRVLPVPGRHPGRGRRRRHGDHPARRLDPRRDGHRGRRPPPPGDGLHRPTALPALRQSLMEQLLALEMVRVTEAAAIASARFMGRGERDGADAAATEAMRRTMDEIEFAGRIVIGEGERDEAPMLYIGERVGRTGADRRRRAAGRHRGRPARGHEPRRPRPGRRDHGPRRVGGGRPDPRPRHVHGEAVRRAGRRRQGRHPRIARRENLRRIAEALGRRVSDITVVILERPRHDALIAEVREAGARIKLIGDGDLSAAISCAVSGTGVHAVMGIGGAPEGVITAAALRCLGGEIQARFRYRSDEERERGARMGHGDEDRVYMTEDLAPGENLVFAATGVTAGDLLQGVRFFGGGARTHSLVMAYQAKQVRFVDTVHMFDRDSPPRVRL